MMAFKPGKITALIIVLVTSAMVDSASASTILSPISVINNTIGDIGATEANMINQTGLSSGFTSGTTDFATYIASNPTHLRGSFSVSEVDFGWVGPFGGPFTGILDFDLGGSFMIKELALWNVAQGSSANVQDFTVFTSTVSNFSTSTNVGTFTNPQLDSEDPYPATVFDLADSIANFVRIQIDSHYGNGGVVEIGELAFHADSAVSNVVPEPSSIAIWSLIGLVGAGVRWRRRRKDA